MARNAKIKSSLWAVSRMWKAKSLRNANIQATYNNIRDLQYRYKKQADADFNSAAKLTRSKSNALKIRWLEAEAWYGWRESNRFRKKADSIKKYASKKWIKLK